MYMKYNIISRHTCLKRFIVKLNIKKLFLNFPVNTLCNWLIGFISSTIRNRFLLKSVNKLWYSLGRPGARKYSSLTTAMPRGKPCCCFLAGEGRFPPLTCAVDSRDCRGFCCGNLGERKKNQYRLCVFLSMQENLCHVKRWSFWD